MRFDDRLSTVLQASFDSPRARASRWRQLTDIVAQSGSSFPEPIAARALHMIALLGRDVPLAAMIAQAAAVASQCQFAPLVVLLAGESPAMTEAVIPVASLSDTDWISAIPQLSPLGRALLRRRNDTGDSVARALYLFSASDLTISTDAKPAIDAAPASPDIRDLVRRIEEYRKRQQDNSGVLQSGTAHGEDNRIAFVTDALARIIDAETRARGRFVGIELGQPAGPQETGCDAGTARIIGRRGPVEHGRLLIQGQDRWSGTWLCEAEPRFSSESGTFRGYTGFLRRPAPHEVAEPQLAKEPSQRPALDRSELVRQLMHELRSPLNAVAGFAQMIEGQYAGPVAQAYLDAARTILAESEALTGVISEIDLLARMDVDYALSGTGPVDCNVIDELDKVLSEIEDAGAGVGSRLLVSGDAREYGVSVKVSVIERLLRLWLQPIVTLYKADQPLLLEHKVSARGDAILLVLNLPPQSLEPSGLGMAFAAAAEMAFQTGGSLEVGVDKHILNLPIVSGADVTEEQVG